MVSNGAWFRVFWRFVCCPAKVQRSTATAALVSFLRFYVTMVGGSAMDLSGAAGVVLTLDTMPFDVYGPAPVAFNIELESEARCSL